MSSIENLSALLQTLSKSEKRYFKLQLGNQTNEKGYIYLFDLLIENETEQKETTFKAKFPKSDFDMARKHLFQAVMKSLRNYEDDKTTDNRLMNALRNTHILFGKGAYNLCFEEIDRAKQLAISHEKFLFYVQFSKLELEIISHFGYQSANENSLLNLNSKAIQLLEQEINSIRHGGLYHALMNRYLQQGHTREEVAHDRLNDLLLEEFQLMTKGNFKSFESEKMHLLFQSAYFLMTANPKAGLKVFRELNDLFLNNTKLWKESPAYYLYMADGILAEMCATEAYIDMKNFITKLETLEVRTEATTLFVQAVCIKFQLLMAYYQSSSNESKTTLQHFNSKIKPKLQLVPSQISVGLLYAASVACFGLRQFKDALGYVNQILNAKAVFISPQIKSLSRILYLFIHIEIGNSDLILYDIRSYERLLKKEKNSRLLESICIQFIKSWISTTEKKKVAMAFKSQLDNLLENTAEMRLFNQLPVNQWLRSKYGI